MGVEGIGARATRKEDKRFITGRGRYTDDMKVPGMHHAAFAARRMRTRRSRASTSQPRRPCPASLGILTGAELAADGIGNLICGWMIKSKDGEPDEDGRLPGARQGDGALCRPGLCGGRRSDAQAQARDAADAIVVDWEELPAVIDLNEAIEKGAGQLHPGSGRQPDLRLGARRRKGASTQLSPRRST